MFVLEGCGPNLDRPGYHPPPDSSTRAPIQIFQDAENDYVRAMNFQFSYQNFPVLSGIKGEVETVLSRYPSAASVKSPAGSVRISNAIEQVFIAKMASLGFQTRDLECVRDYSRLCPSRWVDLGDGKTCEAPYYLLQNVEEPCKKLTFENMTPLEKSNAAFNCGESKFPCRHECVMDFSQTCPQGWTVVKNSVCAAPPTYKQPCVGIYDFANHNFKLKRKFADLCKVSWPCMNTSKSVV